jgi:chromosome segregation ATPase
MPAVASKKLSSPSVERLRVAESLSLPVRALYLACVAVVNRILNRGDIALTGVHALDRLGAELERDREELRGLRERERTLTQHNEKLLSAMSSLVAISEQAQAELNELRQAVKAQSRNAAGYFSAQRAEFETEQNALIRRYAEAVKALHQMVAATERASSELDELRADILSRNRN